MLNLAMNGWYMGSIRGRTGEIEGDNTQPQLPGAFIRPLLCCLLQLTIMTLCPLRRPVNNYIITSSLGKV